MSKSRNVLHGVILGVLFILALFLRLVYLDHLPSGIVEDELNFILTGKSLYITGSDISGLWHPTDLTPIPDEFPQSELSYVFFVPFVGPFPFSLVAARLTSVVVGLLILLISYLIVRKLFGAAEALVTIAVLTINPWSIIFSRTVYEAPIALLLFLTALYILLFSAGWRRLVAIFPIIVGFLTYSAFKVLTIPFLIVVSIYVWATIDKRQISLPIITVIVGTLLFIGWFSVFRLRETNRMNELVFSSSQTKKLVDIERSQSLGNPVKAIISNKYTGGVKEITKRYVSFFNPAVFFADEENIPQYDLWNHGYFYSIELLFFIAGLFFLFKYYHPALWLIILLILISPLPHVLNSSGGSIGLRSSLIFPLVAMIIGIGLYRSTHVLKGRLKIGVIVAISVVYILSLGNFLYTYFFIQPIYAATDSGFSERLAAKYINDHIVTGRNIVYVYSSPKDMYKFVLFYGNHYRKETAEEVTQSITKKNYHIGSARFVTCDGIEVFDPDRTYIFPAGFRCQNVPLLENFIHIARLNDSGSAYDMYQDNVCRDIEKQRFINPDSLTLDDFSVEKKSAEDFCKTFVVEY